jgi:hypothetical protein
MHDIQKLSFVIFLVLDQRVLSIVQANSLLHFRVSTLVTRLERVHCDSTVL